eukprot:gnl/Trimastix_PCT/266.p1 GENE.gnl/Trimastix_PCT/266~~gnl/Trimastix_PCT/266.p1  ORF type:complete len:445 (-),score=161.58 gnl/Trimastix_PCT/266:97-1431(-)
MSKTPKPTLGGRKSKTRKRNIVHPYDSSDFKTRLTDILENPSEQTMEELVTRLAASTLDFRRYGDHFFDVMWTGGCGACVGKYQPESPVLARSFMGAPSIEARQEVVDLVVQLMRRLPFLQKHLEAIVRTLLETDHTFDDNLKQCVASLLAVLLSKKLISAKSLTVLTQNDVNVGNGTTLQILTAITAEYLRLGTVERYMTVLKEAEIDLARFFTFFPPSQRSLEAFSKHFEDSGMPEIVEFTRRRQTDELIGNLRTDLTGRVSDASSVVEEVLAMLQDKKAEHSLEDGVLMRLIWSSLMGSVQWGARPQQVQENVLSLIERWAPLLKAFVSSVRLQADLINHVQAYCYDDPNALALFAEMCRVMYEADVLEEEVILFWFQQGSCPRGRPVFLKQMEPFVHWLQTAEEESDDDESDDDNAAPGKKGAATATAKAQEEPPQCKQQ